MLVRKFEAESMAAALQQVKQTLGSEALILSTRTLGKKGLGVLGKQIIEVTAAIESPAMKNGFRKAVPNDDPKQTTLGKTYRDFSRRVETLEDEQVSLSRTAKDQKVEVRSNPLEDEIRQLRSQLEAQNVNQLQAELNELKEVIKQLAQAQQDNRVEITAKPILPQIQPPQDMKPQQSMPRPQVRQSSQQPLADLLDIMVEQGIDPDAAATIARFAAPQMNDRQRQDVNQCRHFLTSTIATLVQTTGPLWSPGEQQKRISLIGATGVGKTTTIAKLAAEAITQSGARVALVTIDTYRIAAVEQLKVYGEIMGLPVEVVLSPEQLQEAFRRHSDKDLILIDTAGRSPRDQVQIDELSQYLGQESTVENCLVLAAPTEERLQQKTLEAFSPIPLSRLIFTKLDEADRCGSMINLPIRCNLPLAYLTNGQQVPEDLLRADPRTVAEIVMGTTEEPRRMAV
ncbi:flagellar biosynthesis protein FlhF [uncultured Desulfuromusa sp.]|uniref:flagellar biosynthesis protein FlhF n=1 Tax=uncultured Desulfuromusa sp. TaxID=219183 RepID=UPI002AA7CF72|nr:flagellar biosynthesis protein FlhF [uncultured Desulfuromusa sp.]